MFCGFSCILLSRAQTYYAVILTRRDFLPPHKHTRAHTNTNTPPHFLKYQHQFSFILNYTSASVAAVAAKYLFNRYEMDNEPRTHTI